MKRALSNLSLGVIIVVALLVANVLLNFIEAKLGAFPMIERNGALPSYAVKQDLNPRLYDPAVRLEDPEHGFFCSGTVISDDYVLTAAHCLINLDPLNGRIGIKKTPFIVKGMYTTGTGEGQVTAVAAAVNNRADYALVRGQFKDFTKAKLLINPRLLLPMFQLNAPLAVCGFPWGANFACFPMARIDIFYEHLQGTGLLYPGMSGGPAVALSEEGPIVFAVNTAAGNGFIVVSTLVGLFESLGVEVIQ